jgi:hypothetical protein
VDFGGFLLGQTRQASFSHVSISKRLGGGNARLPPSPNLINEL